MSKAAIPILVVVFLILGMGAGYVIGSYTAHSSPKSNSPLNAFAAGSLTRALGNVFNPKFDNITGIKSNFTFSGSIAGADEIRAGSPFDVYVTAAAGVIPQYLMPNYTDWMVIFASNEMAITWNYSKYIIQPSSYWFENISAPGVTIGVSNSSLDPSGFQAIEMVKLAGILYTNWSNPYVKQAFDNNSSEFGKYNRAWNSWFGLNGTLARDGYGGGYPNNDSLALYNELFDYKLRTTGELKLTTVEYGLHSYLTAGTIDYAITYKSQTVDQKLSYFENSNGGNGLPSWINLGSISRAQVEFYGEVNTSGPSIDTIGNFAGGPILYSATILSASKNIQEAQQLIYYLISSLGVSSLKASGFDPITIPFFYSTGSTEPAFLSGLIQPVPSYVPASSYETV